MKHNRINNTARQKIAHFYLVVFGALVAGSTFSQLLPVYLLPLALTPILYLLIFDQQVQSLKQHIYLVIIFFAPFHATVLSWFLQADINGLTGISPRLALLASVFSLVVMAMVMTVAMLPLAYVVWRIKKIVPKHSLLLYGLIPALWVFCEFLRSVAFSVFLYGDGGSIGDYWNFGSLGLVVMQTPLAYLSQYIGMYGLSFSVVCISLALLYIFTKHSKSVGVVLILSLIVLLRIGVLRDPAMATISSTRYASVQSNLSRSDNYSAPIPIRDNSAQPKDLIVLTEYSDIFKPENRRAAKTYVSDRLSSNGVSVDVTSGTRSQRYGTLEFRNSEGALTDSQTKQLLIPTGEYMPWFLVGLYKLIGQSQITETFNQQRSTQKGDPVHVHRTSSLVIGPVACSGILSRGDYRTLVSDGAEVLTNSASLSIFNRSSNYFNQSLAMARFHAIANQRTFIQASKDAPVYVIDSSGSFIVRPDTVASRFTDFSFQKNTTKTLYTKLGEWVLYLSVTALPIMRVCIYSRSRRKH
jgi:apolipoprotein N-acyltransferase